jgi:hypothetical protein
MSDKDTATLLKEVSAELVRVSDDFTKKAESALTEVKNAGKLAEETKTEVDKLATAQGTLVSSGRSTSARFAGAAVATVAPPSRASAPSSSRSRRS